MVDTKKEQERDELHRAIWAIADELRGAVDGWDFKNYVLGTMFYRYISENLCSYVNSGEIEAGNSEFDFAKLSDEDAEEAREGLVEEKGFFILPSELFCNVRANAANDENLNETLERVFRHIEESAKGSESESDFAGLFDDYDVNSNKLGSTVAKRNEKLVKLLNGVGEINDPRFAPAGVLAPKSKADLAFIMHCLSWLASNGTAAIVCFPGIMYRGGAEQKIRKYLIDNNYVDCIIQLPSNLFFGTSIATCIMVMKKNKADNKTLFIDATSECVKVTNNNKLTPENIDRIVDVFAKREEVKHFSHLASYEEVSGNDYNLSVSTYVEAEDTREKIDIVKLNAEIKKIVAREQVLRDEIDRIIAEIEV